MVLVLLWSALLTGCSNESSDPAFGLELRKPDGWTYVSSGDASTTRGDIINYSAAQVTQAINNHGAAPLFALLKRPPPQAGLNPSFGINLTRDGANRGQTGVALLATLVARASNTGQFHIVHGASANKLAAHHGAQAELHTVAQQPAGGVATRVQLHLLLIDDVSVLIAATDAVSGADAAAAEFAEILASLRLPGAP